MRKNVLLLLCALCLLSLFSTTINAQTKTVNGQVADTSGTGLPGVTVSAVGADVSTATANNGMFSITVPTSVTSLRFSSVGFQTTTASIVNETQVNVTLLTAANTLDQVVVIGYGTTRRRDLTGSIATVTSKDFQQGTITTPEQLIAGKVAGVAVTSNSGAPGAGATIRIRGGASLSATNDPLIVVDGVPLETGAISGVADPLSLINPNDIESFNILKDPSATAIYGSRASNGVIIITTKKGRSGGPLRVGFSTVNSLSTIAREVPVLSAQQFRTLVTNYSRAHGIADTTLLGNANTNWQNEIYHKAFSTDNNINFNGGIKGLPYRLSAGYLHQNGIMRTDKLERTSGALNLSPVLFNNTLRIDANVKGTISDVRFANPAAIGTAINFDPTQPVFDKSSPFGGYFEWTQNNIPNPLATRNPVAQLNLYKSTSTVKRSIGNLQLDYKIPFITNLRANVNGGYDISHTKGSIFIPANAASNFTTGGSSNSYSQYRRNLLFDFYLNYANDFKSIRSRIDATAGYEYQDFYVNNPGYNFYTAAGALQTSVAPQPRTATRHTLLSYYGRVNYTLQDRYLLTASIRWDASSRFAPGNRWGTFPAAAFAWRINRESFMRDTRTFSDLKLRLSYGITGQQDIPSTVPNPDYPYLPAYLLSTSGTRYPLGDSSYFTYRPSAYAANIKWEQTSAYDAGLDYGFLGGRINGSIDVYYRKTKNLLLYTAVPAGSNLSNFVTNNVGSLENRGLEFSINAQPLRGDFSWSMNLNFTVNRTKVLSLSNIKDTTTAGILTGNIGGGTGNTIQIHSVGYAPYTFYVYQQLYDANGAPLEGKYANTGSSGAPQFVRFHSPDPKEIFGFTSEFGYRKWGLSFVLRANLGNYVYNNVNAGATLNSMVPSNGFLANVTTNVLKTNFQNSQYFSSYYVENASFLKMDNLTVSYNFGKISKGRMNLRLAAIGQNVFTITGFSGIDPEVFNGINNNLYPRPRIYSLGLNLDY